MVGFYGLFIRPNGADHHDHKEETMKSYEAVFIFRPEEDQFSQGKEAVKAELARINATVVNEEDMGQRALAYPIQKQIRGHYYLYVLSADPQSLTQVDRAFRLKPEILKFLFVKKDK